MKKIANRTKGKSTTHIKKPNKSKKSKKSKRATNKPTRNSKTFKKTYLSKKQRALKELQNAVKSHILNIIRAHKTKRKQAGGNPEQDQKALVGGGRFMTPDIIANSIAQSIAAFFKWLKKMIDDIFSGKSKNNNGWPRKKDENNYSNPNINPGTEMTEMKILKRLNNASQQGANKTEITNAMRMGMEQGQGQYPPER
jgi:hypothetical protein